MQVPALCDAGLDVLMQVRGCFNAGPRMVQCRSADGAMQVLGWCDTGSQMCKFDQRKISRGK